MRFVKIDLGKRSYDVVIGNGLFKICADFLAKSSYSKKAVIVTDETVDKLYYDSFVKAVENTGFKFVKVVVPSGEGAKSFSWAEQIYTKAIEAKLDRKSVFIALGGGVVGDLTGFVAATFMRGVPFIQVPTTLLAQVDASVGGKVAVNHPLGKNMIGAFHQPDIVLADIHTLKSLSERDYASGLAEVVKYACLDEKDLLEFLETNSDKIIAKDDIVLSELIARCCEYKAFIVAADELESGKRMFLNLGHTYGHAVEAEGDFSLYTHGESVAIGLYGAMLLSEQVAGFSPDMTKRVCALLEKFGLPLVADKMDKTAVYENLWHDKKAINDNLQWVLLKKIGEAFVESNVANSALKKALENIVK